MLSNCQTWEEITLPQVRKIGNCFLINYKNELIINAPNLLEVDYAQIHIKLFRIVEENIKRKKMKKVRD